MFQIHPGICGEVIKTHETRWRLNSSTRYVAVAAEQTAFVAESLQDQLQTIKHQETQIHRTSERPKEGDKTAGKLTPCKNRNHLGLFGCSGSKNLGNIRKLGNSKYSKSFRRCLTNHPKAWRSSVVAPGGASAVQMHCPAVSFSSMHTALDIENNVHQWIVGSVLKPKEQFYVFSFYQKLSISKRARMGEGLMLAQHRLGYVRLLTATCKPSTIITRLATMTSGSVTWAHR